MAEFLVRYTVTEVNTEEIWIEADSAEDAVKEVEDYAFDNSESQFVRSHEYFVENVRVVPNEGEVI